MLLRCHAMLDQLGAHLGKRIVLGYDRHLLPEVDDYVAQLTTYGTVVTDSDPERLHYLTSTEQVCRRVRGRADAVGVLACKTGIGVSIAANKFGGVYAARCLSVADAELARTINNANVLCLAVSAGAALNAAIIDAFMRTPYQGRKLDELAGLRRFERRTKDRGRLGATEPDLRFASVEQIDVGTLASRGITGVLADLDGTLVGDHQQEVAGSVTAWVDMLRASGIGVCIVSNSGPARVAPLAAALDVPYRRARREAAALRHRRRAARARATGERRRARRRPAVHRRLGRPPLPPAHDPRRAAVVRPDAAHPPEAPAGTPRRRGTRRQLTACPGSRVSVACTPA